MVTETNKEADVSGKMVKVPLSATENKVSSSVRPSASTVVRTVRFTVRVSLIVYQYVRRAIHYNKWHRLLRFTSSLSYDILLDDEICLSQIKDMLISLPFPQNITIIELRQAEPCYLYVSYSAS